MTMDFPLIPIGPPPGPFGERVEPQPQIYPLASALDRAAQGQPLLIKKASWLDPTPYIDVEFQDNTDQIEPLPDSRPGIDFPLKKAMILYFKVGEERQQKKLAIDLYI
jgi:hypothetical protein